MGLPFSVLCQLCQPLGHAPRDFALRIAHGDSKLESSRSEFQLEFDDDQTCVSWLVPTVHSTEARALEMSIMFGGLVDQVLATN